MSAAAPSPMPHEPARESDAPAPRLEIVPDLAPPPAPPFFLTPTFGILMGNLITLAGAVVQHWPALPVMLVYWGQSVSIGVINVIRMLKLKEFSTDGFTSNGHPVPTTRQGQVSTARFFAFHYGFFHLGYALFLFRGGHVALSGWVAVSVAFNVAWFALSHAWPLITSGGQDYKKKPNLGTMMFYPYLRIIPMHLAIILGAAFPLGALPFFMLLKTGADLGMHEIERRMFRGVE